LLHQYLHLFDIEGVFDIQLHIIFLVYYYVFNNTGDVYTYVSSQ